MIRPIILQRSRPIFDIADTIPQVMEGCESRLHRLAFLRNLAVLARPDCIILSSSCRVNRAKRYTTVSGRWKFDAMLKNGEPAAMTAMLTIRIIHFSLGSAGV
jgi:hypothetical protein